MRWTTLFLSLAILAFVAVPAAAERNLAQAVALAIAEAENLEHDLGTTLIRNSPTAKRLRRGKRYLREGIEAHGKGKWGVANRGLAKGLGRLLKAFEAESAQPGLDSLGGIVEELEQYVVAAIADLTPRVAALPDSPKMKRAGKSLQHAAEAHASAVQLDPRSDRAMIDVVYAYDLVASARRKVEKVEQAGTTDIGHLGKLIPGNLPRGSYSIATETNGVPSLGVYWSNPNTPKLQKRVIKNIVQGIAVNRRDGRTCQESCTATPFDGTTFTITVVLTCTTGGTTTVVFTMRKVS